MNIKHAFVQCLKADAGVSTLFGSRVYPRLLDRFTATLPAAVVIKSGGAPWVSHSGAHSVGSATLDVFVFAETDAALEDAKDIILAAANGKRLEHTAGAVTMHAACICVDDADYEDDDVELIELGQFGGRLRFEVDWSREG